MPTKLTALLERVPADVEAMVKQARDRARPVLQDALRAECRLVMRTPDEAEMKQPGAQVRVEIAPGHPVVLDHVIFSDNLDRILMLARYRKQIGQARTGAAGLLELRRELATLGGIPENAASEESLHSTARWAASLLKTLNDHDPLKTVLSVREDFLGVYEFSTPSSESLFPLMDEYAVNRAGIKLYWAVIGLVAAWMGCPVDDLAVVVLAHELAHAYTQLGADIDGRRWPAQRFAEAEAGLVEGLAQYYTERVLRRSQRQFAGALNVFLALLAHQPEQYRTHTSWVDGYTPEAVRRAMLEVRRWNEGTVEQFNSRLAAAQDELGPS